jgi:hypothetical protein
LFGEPDSLVTVYADLTDLENPSVRSEEEGGPVEIGTYTKADRFRVGHSYPGNKTSNMTDYSITTHKNKPAHHIAGLVDEWYGTNNVRDRFTDWAQSDAAERVREEADDRDRAILDALAALGDNEAAMEALSESLLSQVEDEETELDALITVALKLPNEDGWKLPGEVPVLNDVMRAKKAARLESISVEDASGDGTGYVTNQRARVTGGSPGLFGMFGKKQREHFPDLDTKGESAWRLRPLEFDTAAAVAAAGSLLGDFYRGLGSNRRLYILPYLAARRDQLDPATFEWFHERVYKTIQTAEAGSDGNFDDEIESLFAEGNRVRESSDVEMGTPSGDDDDLVFDASPADWDSVRFAVVHQVTGNPDRVFFDTLDGVSPARELSNEHARVLQSEPFAKGGIFHDNPVPDASPLLGRGIDRTRMVLYGLYFRLTTEPTRSSREASETPGAGSITDSRMLRVRNLLTGTRIDASDLLEEYIHQLVQEQREQFGNDDGYIAFPKRDVVVQYAQSRALASMGVLDTSDTIPFTTTEMTTDTDTRSDDLEAFIKSHDALDGAAEKAIFTLGGLVGRITAYQSHKKVSSTLVRRYPVDYLTKQTVVEVTKEVMQMDNSYAEADDRRSYWTNSRYKDRLTDTMLAANPRTWSLTEAEIQWLYSLGIAYGLSDTSEYSEEDEQSAEEELEA